MNKQIPKKINFGTGFAYYSTNQMRPPKKKTSSKLKKVAGVILLLLAVAPCVPLVSTFTNEEILEVPSNGAGWTIGLVVSFLLLVTWGLDLICSTKEKPKK